MSTPFGARGALVVLVLAGVACSDSTGPGGRLVDENQIVAQCSAGTIDDATTAQVLTGSLSGADCRIRGDDGRLEGYRVPQTAFGAMTEILFELEADFDAAIVITDPNGEILAVADDDLGGNFGSENIVLSFDLDASEPEYFVVVYDIFNESGAYYLTVGPVP